MMSWRHGRKGWFPDLMKTRYPHSSQDVLGRMKVQGRYAAGYPSGAIVHFTAGGRDAVATVEGGIRDGFCFFVIGPDGHVYQNFEAECWGSHAGPSETRRQREPLLRRNRGLLRGQGSGRWTRNAFARGSTSRTITAVVVSRSRGTCRIPRGILLRGRFPPLCFAPARYPVVAERFQEFANEIAGLRLEEDGMAGEKTSGAFKTIFGYPLVGREESTYRPTHADRYRNPVSGCGAGALE